MRRGTIGRLMACAAVAVAMSAVLVADASQGPRAAGVPQDPAEIAVLPPRPAVPRTPPTSAQSGVAAPERVVPARLVIVRPGSIDSLAAGVVVRRVARDDRAVSLVTLAAAVPRPWMTISGSTARLDAAVQLTAGTRLEVDGVRTLELAGGDDPRAAAFLATGSGQIRLHGVTVASIDPASGQPVAPGAAGRPYIRVSNWGTLTAVDSTITDLGAQPIGVLAGRPAVSFGRGSTGALTRTTLTRSSTGLELAGSRGVTLQDVTVTESSDNGIVLRGDRATALSHVRAERNSGNGVLVAGETTNRPITGITTVGNGAYGVSVSGQHNAEISDLTLSGDQAGGLELERVSDSHVHDVTSTDAPVGVFLHVNSTNVAVDTLSVSGGRTGVLVEKTTAGLRFTNSTIRNVHVAGVAYDGRDGLLAALTVRDSATAVRVERGAGALTIDRLSILGGEDGLVASGGIAGVVVKNLWADGVSNDAIRSAGAGMQIVGGEIRGGHTGMDLRAATTITGTQVHLSAIGVEAGGADPIVLDDVTIDTEAAGIAAGQGSAVTLKNSAVHALHALLGEVNLVGANDVSLPPPNLLGVIGLPLILLALVLEFLHLWYQFRRKRKSSRDYLRRWRTMAEV